METDLYHQPRPITPTSELHLPPLIPPRSVEETQLCIPPDLMHPMPFLQQPSPPATRSQPPTPPPISAIHIPILTQDGSDTDWDAHFLFSENSSSSHDDKDQEPDGGATDLDEAPLELGSDQDAEGELDELEASGDEKYEVPEDYPVEEPSSSINALGAMNSEPREASPSVTNATPSAAEEEDNVYPEVGLEDLDDPQPSATARGKRKRSPDDDDGAPLPTRRPRFWNNDDDEEYVPSRPSSVCELSDEEREETPLPPPPESSAKKRKRAVKNEEDEDDSHLAKRPRKARKARKSRKSRKLFAQEDLTCHVCGETLSRPSDVKRHRETTHERRFWICEVCNKKFSRNDALRRHTGTQHKDLLQLEDVGEGALQAQPRKTRSTRGERPAKQSGSKRKGPHSSHAEWTPEPEDEDDDDSTFDPLN